MNFWQWLKPSRYALVTNDGKNTVISAVRKTLKQKCKDLDLERVCSQNAFSVPPPELANQIDYTAATRLMTSRIAAYSLLMTWCIKIKTRKLKVRVADPNALNPDDDIAPELLCPFAEDDVCPSDEPETIEHVFCCKGTEDVRQSLPKVILEIVNRCAAVRHKQISRTRNHSSNGGTLPKPSAAACESSQ